MLIATMVEMEYYTPDIYEGSKTFHLTNLSAHVYYTPVI